MHFLTILNQSQGNDCKKQNGDAGTFHFPVWGETPMGGDSHAGNLTTDKRHTTDGRLLLIISQYTATSPKPEHLHRASTEIPL